MISSQRLRSVIKTLAVVMAVAMPLAVTISSSV
ncbi:MAG: hypothetical protein ACJAVZ_004212, partial [Afipia broomeae]